MSCLNRRCSSRVVASAVIMIVLACIAAGCGSSDDASRRAESAADEIAEQPAVESSETAADERADPTAVESGEATAGDSTEPLGVEPGEARAEDSTADRLVPMMSWQWQLQGELNTTYDADVYDIDLFDTSRAQITELRYQGRYVVCYFSAGSFEDWRDDAGDFPTDALGEPLDGWEGERWLDVRNAAARSVLEARLDLATDKGCDGVEPDNVTATNNDSGFDITSDDQLDFNRFLADEAHARGLSIGLKNDLDQIPELVDWFDFAVNEECFEYDECDVYAPFIDAGKPVFNAEYAAEFATDPDPVCERAATLGLSTLILDLDLDDSLRIACS